MDLASEIERNVAAALAEDVGDGDATAPLTAAVTPARATVMCRQDAVVCGQPWFDACFRKLDPKVEIQWAVAEGSRAPRFRQVARQFSGRHRVR